jgi:tRNA(Ser,Leu) C12 N-acetylase TAN1
METVRHLVAEKAKTLSYLARVIPLTRMFRFQTPEQFEAEAKEAALMMAPSLSGKSFHVRMHRRGFKGRLSSEKTEQLLDTLIVDALQQTTNPARVSFERPEAILALETLGQHAGLSLWTREELQRYPFLGLD